MDHWFKLFHQLLDLFGAAFSAACTSSGSGAVRMVSGLAASVTSSSPFLPRRWPISASVARAAFLTSNPLVIQLIGVF